MRKHEMETSAKHILIVDDDQDFAESLEDFLLPRGYEIKTVFTADSVKNAMNEFNPQVMLVDLRIGNAKGTDLIPMVRDKNPNVLFVLMTAFADTDTAIEALQRGADDYLRKPLNLDVLTSTLDRCFRNIRLREEKEIAIQSLQANERRFRRLIEDSLQGIAIHREFQPVFVNQAFADLFGYDSTSEIVALDSLLSLVAPKDLPALKGKQKNADSEKGPWTFQTEFSGMRKDGKEIRLDSFSQEIQWEGHTAIQVSLVDISERAVLEQQLRQAQKMEAVGQLAGGIAHDINNMLQIIRGYSELAFSNAPADSSIRSSLDKVLRATEGASSMTRQLLAFSRQEVIMPRPLDINKLIADLMKMLHRIIGEDIDLKINAGELLNPVLADSGMIEQVLVNLCVNARDAMPEGGQLTINTENFPADHDFCKLHGWANPGNYVLISVTDSGHGMSAEVMEHIFEPFYTTKGAGKGTGLGLSMVYGIVNQHRGMVDVYSEVGIGTTFKVYLPVGESLPEEMVSPAVLEVSGGGETILLAEDEETVLFLAVELLETKGYRVLTAANGEDVVRLFAEHQDEVDLVMLDVVMPKMGGRAAFGKIRAMSPHVPILFSTGFSANHLDEDFIRDSEFKLINKPYSPSILYSTVRTMLDESNRGK